MVNEETFKEIYSQFFPQGGKCKCGLVAVLSVRIMLAILTLGLIFYGIFNRYVKRINTQHASAYDFQHTVKVSYLQIVK